MSASVRARTPRRSELVEAYRLRRLAWQRALRLWSGIVLFVFLTMHLLNHAVAIFGLDAMQQVQVWRVALWQSWPGTILLYGSFAVHAVFALKRMIARRTWRMPAGEWAQIVLGLLIPVLLASHVVGTRVMGTLYQGDQSYGSVLRSLWSSRPILQALLVICAWTHGVIGLHHTFRTKPWFAAWLPYGIGLAATVPILALAGFAVGGREAADHLGPPDALTAAQTAGHFEASWWAFAGLAFVAVVLTAALAWRFVRSRRAGLVSVRYTGHGAVRIPRGLSVLEASRIRGIPHPALCGGRARCSTCRILVLEGLDALPEPVQPELSMLKRISAPRSVRLACQVRPQSDIAVQILLPAASRRARTGETQGDIRTWGEERNVTVLVVDMRAFNTLASRQYPHDIAVLLNRFIAEMSQTVSAHGGRVEALMTDGLTAVFGLSAVRRKASRDAVLAARDMLKVCRSLDAELGSAMPMPLRIGIGIHTGRAIVAQFADPALGGTSLTLGATVSIAAALEAGTKHMLADCLISDATLAASGLKLPQAIRKELHLPGQAQAIVAHAVSEAAFEEVSA